MTVHWRVEVTCDRCGATATRAGSGESEQMIPEWWSYDLHPNDRWSETDREYAKARDALTTIGDLCPWCADAVLPILTAHQGER